MVMTEDDHAKAFQTLFTRIYFAAVRRVDDKRDRLSPETVAFLAHMEMAGPLTPGELAQHIGRAPSTLSEMLAHLLDKGLIERDRDPEDARRALIWLSPSGRSALARERQVLDPHMLAEAFTSIGPESCARLLQQLEVFVAALTPQVQRKD